MMRRSLLSLAMALLVPALVSAQSPSFTLGVLPNVSARVIATQYEPFREHLQARLGGTVEVVTAPDFREYFTRGISGAYDVWITAANLARLAEVDHGQTPIAIYEPGIPALYVTLKDKPLGALTDIKGKAVAMANPQSLVALRAIQELRRVGLEQGRDFRVELTRNEDSLAQLLRVGDAPMAVMSMGEFRAIREDIRQTLTIHQEFARVPGFVAMAGKPMDAARRDTIAQALTGFVATEGGVRFKAATGVQEIRAIRPGELATLDAIVAPTRQGLGR